MTISRERISLSLVCWINGQLSTLSWEKICAESSYLNSVAIYQIQRNFNISIMQIQPGKPHTSKHRVIIMNPQNGISNEYKKNNGLSWLPEPLLNLDPTIVASSLSVLALMILGSCIWCFAHFRRKFQKDLASALDSANSTPCSESNKIEHFFEGWKAESSGDGEAKQKMMNGTNGKKNNFGKGIYKNIITPDKSIPFVIPTIPLPAQPISSEREICPELATCSKTLSQSSIPKDFYPQLVQGGESDHPKLGFSLFYEAGTQILYVRLLGGRNMPDHVRHCISLKLYPGRGAKQRTPEFEEAAPTYNQEFSFHIRKSTLCTRVLRFKAVILETPKKQIGSLNLALKELPGFEVEDTPTDLQSTHIWKFLENGAEAAAAGEGIRLRVSIQWQEEPPPGLLTLKIIEATGLHENNGNDFTSTHVKVTLQEQGRFIKSRKTRLVRWGSVPVYDDVFVVTIPQDLLSQISFRLEVIARGRLGSKVALGKISIGSMPYASPFTEGMEFWEDMCHQPNKEIFRWLQLVAS